MTNLDIIIKFCREVSADAQKAFILDDKFNVHINSIMHAENGEFTWTITYNVEDEKEEILILDKLSSFAGIKAFSIEFREFQVNPMEELIPYIPQILARLIG